MGRRLIIFTKNPILGTAKTRIGRVKGDDVALAVYKSLLKYTRDVVREVDAEKVVFFNKHLEPEGIWSGTDFQQKLQVAGDLGDKMRAAISGEFAEGGSPVVIIGSDCAEINAYDINGAFRLLEEQDVVIGPAVDGGYYLLGMNKYYPELLEEMPWSEERLLEETKSTVSSMELSSCLLDTKTDIDFWEDWEKLGWPLELDVN